MQKLNLVGGAAALVSASIAMADMRITEWMYSGADGEFVELTNVGVAPIDLSGWSFDDDSQTPGVFGLGGFGMVAPGESVVFTESDAEAFRTAWGLGAEVKILGGVSNNLGRNDQINIYDGANALADVLTFGDEDFPGTIRTQAISGWALPASLGLDDVSQWFFSASGDALNSSFSTSGDLGNPGRYVPAPAAAALLGLAGLTAGRRRRA